MTTKFTSDQFVPTQWNTAEDKSKFANHMIRFIEGDFKDTLFPKWFYQRLSNTFGHIAHYDISGFYYTWFSNIKTKVSFLENLIEHGTQAPGDPAFTYRDVEHVLANYVRKAGYLNKYQKLLTNEIEIRERDELKRLIKKYGTI